MQFIILRLILFDALSFTENSTCNLVKLLEQVDKIGIASLREILSALSYRGSGIYLIGRIGPWT